MAWLKRLETWGKLALARAASVLLWRPGRRERATAALNRPRRVLLVRIDNRVGEALLTTPLLSSLKARSPAPEVHVLVHEKAARVLAEHPSCDRVIPFDRRWLVLGPWAPGIRAMRRILYDVVVECSSWTAPSVTAAIVSRLVAPHSALIGPQLAATDRLHDISVIARPDTQREALQRLNLLWPLGAPVIEALSFRQPRASPQLAPLLSIVASRPSAIVNPGGRLGERRVPPEAFSAAARALLATGRMPLVTWGPGEELLARAVVDAAPGASLAPPTGLDDLAALMQAARLTVCNNTGPMHLSVAMGVPTLALFLRMDMERWGHPYPPHRMLDVTPWLEAGQDVPALVAEEVRAFAQAQLRSSRAGTPATSTTTE
jgi:heptosyltransferase-3